MRSEMISKRDTVLLETENLSVWIRRPDFGHRNWWLAYCSSGSTETWAWERAIQNVCTKLEMSAFHQGCWPGRGHNCGGIHHDLCEDTVQAWEFWGGCSEFALEFPDDTLEEIRACGDTALDRLLEAFPVIKEEAERLTKVYS